MWRPGRSRRIGLRLALLAAPLASTPVAATPPASAHVVFRLQDTRLDEISGIGRGIASPGVLYMQNDSGDSARFFALDGRTGRVLATYAVPHATNVDWEDLAVARDADGMPSVWLADIGDNDANRSEVRIYRVNEPRVDTALTNASQQASPPDVWRLRYPGGPVNAESLAVAPGGAAYIFTKSLLGVTKVFAVPPRPDPSRVQLLRRIGTIRFHLTGTPDALTPIGELTATGASLSPNGRRLVVRTYSDAYIWRVVHGDVAAALRTTPIRIPLPEQPQGEGVCFDGRRLLIDSEHAGSTVDSVRLPRGSAPPPGRPPPSSAAELSRTPVAHPATAHPHRPLIITLAAVAAACAAAGGLMALRLRRSTRR